MAAEVRCAACGGEIAAGLQFCVHCGARQPASCSSCGTAHVEGAAFCGSCGAAVSAAAPEASAPDAPATSAPPTEAAAAEMTAVPTEAAAAETTAVPTDAGGPAPPATPTEAATPAALSACGQCGEPLREGARFCRKCGAATAPGAVAPAAAAAAGRAAQATAQPQPVSAQAIMDQLTWSSVAAGLGFVIAILSVFFPWVKASAGGLSVDAGPLDDNALFRIGDVLGSNTSSIDGLATLLVAVAGLVALVASLLGRVNAATARSLITGLGGALLALGFVEIQYVSSQPEPAGVSISLGFGLYILVLGGALALASPRVPARRLKG